MSFHIESARIDDAQELFQLINDAYDIETGDMGVAFKQTKRLIDLQTELIPLIMKGTLLVARSQADCSLLGTLFFEITTDSIESAPHQEVKRLHFGPFAVSNSARGCGVGKALLLEVWEYFAFFASLKDSLRWSLLEEKNTASRLISKWSTGELTYFPCMKSLAINELA